MTKIGLFLSTLALLGFMQASPALARKWNNPQNEQRYKEALQRQAEAYREESKAWQNYAHEMGRAKDDVRRVRDHAINGAIRGGLPGAAWGAAKGAGKSLLSRANDYRKDHKRR